MLTKESTILYLRTKLQAYKAGFIRATAKGDSSAAIKWKDGYLAIQERIAELKET